MPLKYTWLSLASVVAIGVSACGRKEPVADQRLVDKYSPALSANGLLSQDEKELEAALAKSLAKQDEGEADFDSDAEVTFGTILLARKLDRIITLLERQQQAAQPLTQAFQTESYVLVPGQPCWPCPCIPNAWVYQRLNHDRKPR